DGLGPGDPCDLGHRSPLPDRITTDTWRADLSKFYKEAPRRPGRPRTSGEPAGRPVPVPELAKALSERPRRRQRQVPLHGGPVAEPVAGENFPGLVCVEWPRMASEGLENGLPQAEEADRGVRNADDAGGPRRQRRDLAREILDADRLPVAQIPGAPGEVG